MTTINKQISLGTDDCYELDDSSVDLTGTTTRIGYNFGVYDTGLRWQSVNIAKDTTLTSATLRLYQTGDTGTLEATIKGIAEDDTATWSSGSRPSQRGKTSATINADEGNWSNWGIGNWIYIDITSIIQEIINRAGWSANNDLAIAIEEDAYQGFNYIDVRSYEYSGNVHGAKLDIVYGAVTAKPAWYYEMLKRRNSQ